MKYTLKVFGVPVLSFERDDNELERFISNAGGQFEICTEDPESAEEDWEYEEDSGKFGFRV